MTQTYNIMTTHPDIRVLKTFKVTGNDEECLKKARKEFEIFIEDLRLEPE